MATGAATAMARAGAATAAAKFLAGAAREAGGSSPVCPGEVGIHMEVS